MAVLERMDSLPPRRTQTLPARKVRLAASEVTLGRDSKMMAMTPRGTETRLTSRPLSRVWEASVRPTGSGRAATSRTPLAMSRMRSGGQAQAVQHDGGDGVLRGLQVLGVGG